MQDLLEWPKAPTLFSPQCGVATGQYQPIIHPDESLFVDKSCDNPFRKNIVTCKDKFLHEFIDEVDGLALDINLSNTINTLPDYIPILDRESNGLPSFTNDYQFVGLGLIDLLPKAIGSKHGFRYLGDDSIFNKLLLNSEPFKNRKVILFSSGPDLLIESVWWNRTNNSFFENIANSNIYGATGINFSLFAGECALSHSLNQKRSLYSSSIFEQCGVKTIPHVYALNSHHVKKWVYWLKENPQARYFTINCQMQKNAADLNVVVCVIKKILLEITDVHVLLHGFPFELISNLHPFLPRIHFADSSPLKRARSKFRIIFNENTNTFTQTHDPNSKISEIAEFNFNQKRQCIEFHKFNNRLTE